MQISDIGISLVEQTPILAGRSTHPKLMSSEEPRESKSSALRLMELHWQREVIERWLQDSFVPPDSRAPLEELLSSVDRELAEVETKLKGEGIARRWIRAS
jgi:hypothetical protein